MQVVRHTTALPEDFSCVLAIGNFDGVHVGHQAILKQLTTLAQSHQLPSVVMTFEPQPDEFFGGDTVPARLMCLRDKYPLLQAEGVDYLYCQRFNAAFASMQADDFVRDMLVRGLNIKAIIVGDDFRFGAKRAGDVAMLRATGAQHGFEVVQLSSFLAASDRVSSTLIRAKLQTGDMLAADRLLGHPFSITGRVAHGNRLGRKLGFPTANLFLQRQVVPLQGIFVVTVAGLGDVVQGVANVGTRPAVGGSRVLLEVHLFDFDADIYGEKIQVNFHHKLRDEENYASLDLLREAIGKDVAQARQYFADCVG